jgi:hypothetical protein
MWLSVDPLVADGTFFDGGGNSVGFYDAKNHAAYSFAHNNPIIITDPDGKDIILRGRNGSKIVVQTSLISIEANLSTGPIQVDFGGTYNLKGTDILIACLDIIGIVDPSGVADGLAATLEAKQGNWGSAFLSGLGVIPYVGDVGKLGKISKHLKTIDNAIDTSKLTKILTKGLIKEGKWFSKEKYRHNLQVFTGKLAKGFDAHHTFPKSLEKWFKSKGIDVHDPAEMLWREFKDHRKKSQEHLKEWNTWIKEHGNATIEQIKKQRDVIEKKIWGSTKGDKPTD